MTSTPSPHLASGQAAVPLSRRRGTTVMVAMLGLMAIGVPLLLVVIPPLTDLPQQVAQIRLLETAMEAPDGPYRVQWWEPNKLGYLPLWLAWQVTSSPLAAGRLGVFLIGAAWIVAILWLARKRQRPLASGALACALFFNHALYWGLLNFLVGLPVFLLWCGLLLPRVEAEDAASPSRGLWLRRLGLALVALLLYSAHVLWLGAGVAVWMVCGVAQRRVGAGRGRWLLDGVALLPVLIAVGFWYPRLAARGFDSDTFWSLGQRWNPGWWVGSAFGGLQGRTENILAGLLLLWILGACFAAWRTDASLKVSGRVDGMLLVVGLGAVAASLLLPGVYQNTVFFASRWLPVGLVLVLLALPTPKLRRPLPLLLALLVLPTLSAATVGAWLTFEGEELAGLHQALWTIESDDGAAELEATARGANALPRPRVLGLDFVRTSESIKGFPYYHLYAWSQALHGGELARSFANEASSLVVYKDLPRSLPWTEGLDWRARKLRRSDIDHFDYVVLHGEADMQRLFYDDPRLEPLTPPSRWTLFRVQPAGPSLAAPPSASSPQP